MGSVLIVFGLYSVLWGKNKEMNHKEDSIEVTITEAIMDNEKDGKIHDMELQYIPSNGNHQYHVAT